MVAPAHCERRVLEHCEAPVRVGAVRAARALDLHVLQGERA